MTKEEIANEIKPMLEELSYASSVAYLTQNKKWLEGAIKILEQTRTSAGGKLPNIHNHSELFRDILRK